ncbi:hypothetical protein B0H13DRAFT_1921118 [Mycena leptocephala]|nr:hypothetical protein B0H13DRAFT_1921118 [Mycena leptocephala]
MSAPPSETVVFRGHLGKLKKDYLQTICRALGKSESEVKKPKSVLIGLIEGELEDESKSFSSDPRFIALERHAPKETKKKRTSADKTADDLAASKGPKAPTPAELKLHNQKVTTDPAPSFRPLSLQTKAATGPKKAKKPEPSSSPLSSIAPSSSESNHSNRDEEKEEEKDDATDDGRKDSGEDKKDSEEDEMDVPGTPPPSGEHPTHIIDFSPKVLVSFKHPFEGQHPAEQVYVNNVKIMHSTSPGGTVKNEAMLTDVIRKAIENNSPIKGDRAGRFSRPGLHNKEEIMGVGSVGQHLEQTGLPSSLNFERTSPASVIPAPTTTLTGASSDKPLEITNNRRTPASHRIVATEADHPFCVFLREFAQESTLSQDTHVVGGDCLDGYLEFKPFMAKFLPFSKTKKGPGYYIPPNFQAPASVVTPGWEQYRNCTFTQDEIILAAGLRRTTTRENIKIFVRIKELGGDLLQWMKTERPSKDDGEASDSDPDSTSPNRFPYENMKRIELHNLVNSRYEDLQEEKPEPYKKSKAKKDDKLRKSSSHASSSKAKKRHTSDVSEEERSKKKRKKYVQDESDEDVGRTKTKDKGKATAPDSDRMDSDSE